MIYTALVPPLHHASSRRGT